MTNIIGEHMETNSTRAAVAGAVAGTPGLDRAQWRMILIASLGGSLEFYDFVIYGFFAHYIAARFFPATDRPLGGIVLSSLGDRIGRRPVFIASIAIVTFATICIGLLPDYSTWGIAAPIALMTLRVMQGFCVGGEMPGAITYAVEAAPHRAGLAAGVIICAVNTGVMLATIVNLVVQSVLSPVDAAAYGWRIAFLIGGVCGILSYLLRRNLEESPEFTKMRGAVVRQPFRETLRHHRGAVVAGALSIAVMAGFNGVLYGHMPAYLVQTLHYAPRTAAVAQNAYLLVSSVGLLVAGWAGDYVPRRYLLLMACVLLAVLSYPFYAALVAHSMNLTLLFVLAALVFSLASGTWASVLADFFPVKVRYSGISLAYNVSVVIFSGFAPLLCAALTRATGSPAAPAWYVVGCALVTLLAGLAVNSSARLRQPDAGLTHSS
jgi:MFS transporter, MHS family, proline/betaine transporter